MVSVLSFSPLYYMILLKYHLLELTASKHIVHGGMNVMSFAMQLPCGSKPDAICQCRWAIAYGAPGGDGEHFMKYL